MFKGQDHVAMHRVRCPVCQARALWSIEGRSVASE